MTARPRLSADMSAFTDGMARAERAGRAAARRYRRVSPLWAVVALLACALAGLLTVAYAMGVGR